MFAAILPNSTLRFNTRRCRRICKCVKDLRCQDTRPCTFAKASWCTELLPIEMRDERTMTRTRCRVFRWRKICELSESTTWSMRSEIGKAVGAGRRRGIKRSRMGQDSRASLTAHKNTHCKHRKSPSLRKGGFDKVAARRGNTRWATGAMAGPDLQALMPRSAAANCACAVCAWDGCTAIADERGLLTRGPALIHYTSRVFGMNFTR